MVPHLSQGRGPYTPGAFSGKGQFSLLIFHSYTLQTDYPSIATLQKVEAVSPHLCDPNKTIALQLHIDLQIIVFTPYTACISIQAPQRHALMHANLLIVKFNKNIVKCAENVLG